MGFVPDRDFLFAAVGNGETLVWYSAQPQPTEAEIDAAALPALKSRTITANRAEARRRIEAKYPLWRQQSAVLGVYPEAYTAQMSADIAAVVSAENTAADLIDAATTEAEVAAVTVNWPVI
jgi:hypothetical protein